MDNKTLITLNTIEVDTLPLSLKAYIVSKSSTSRANEESRISLYENWLLQNKMDGITTFDLVAYKNFLISIERQKFGLRTLSNASAAAHINTIRARYLYMLDKAPSKLRDYLYDRTPKDASPSDRKAYVDEMQLRIRERVQDQRASIHIVQQSDEADNRFIRLSYSEMLSYCTKPLEWQHTHSITGIRDSAILSVLCMTGLREDELVNLNVNDLYQKMSGYEALEVRRGKGAKQRIVPYGTFHEMLMSRIQAWLRIADIQSGALFRGLTKWGTVRKSRISKRAINVIVGTYPTEHNREVVILKPHDCRRSYARILRYEFNMPIEGISKNLGHQDTKTTQSYIGDIDIDNRIPRRSES
ncbi:MAG: tyrosine-type recombinase/integrase [Phototrophicaceae bacterium]